eukprot:gene12692-17018_t
MRGMLVGVILLFYQYFLSFTAGEKIASNHVVMESAKIYHRSDIHRVGKSIKSDYHEVTFAVQQNSLDKLEQLLDEISDPDNNGFGLHLTRDEVHQLTKNEKSLNALLSFLSVHDITYRVSTYGEYVTAVAPIQLWEEIFDTEFHLYRQSVNSEVNDEKDVMYYRALSYSLPKELKNHVHAVFKTVQFPVPSFTKVGPIFDSPSKNHNKHESLLSSTGYVTPKFLKSYYNLTQSSANMQTQAIYAPAGYFYSLKDLRTFERINNLTTNYIRDDPKGGMNDTICKTSLSACLEGNFDTQYITAVAPNANTTYFFWSGTDLWLTWIEDVASMQFPPKVISISYGNSETDISSSYFELFNVEAIKLALQGVTLIAASGDDGVGGFGARSNSAKCGYNPYFPTSSTYVTSVGGTFGPESGTSEKQCQKDQGCGITSGGGISDQYSIPSYQKYAVSNYLSSTSPSITGYNTVGRGYPDISLLANYYTLIVDGQTVISSGTSVSAPVFAGMITLINAERKNLNLGSVGFLNPSLYKYNTTFVKDITDGDNKCTAGSTCCTQGFSGAKGWDPVTGLGAVNFNKLKTLLVSLGNRINAPTASPTNAPTVSIAPTQSVAVGVPTITPSSAPSFSPSGFVLSTLYADVNCRSGDKLAFTAYKTGQCLPLIYYYNQSATVYVRYGCGSGGVTTSYFSDSSCTLLKSISKESLGCSATYDDTGINEAFLSSELTCLSSSVGTVSDLYSQTVQQFAGDASYIYTANETYADNDATILLKVFIYRNNYCFSFDNHLWSGLGYQSFSFVNTNLQFIILPFCEISASSASQSLSININEPYVYSFDQYQSLPTIFKQFTTNTRSPTAQPSLPRPTLNPSIPPPTYKPSSIPSVSPTTRLPTSAPSFQSYVIDDVDSDVSASSCAGDLWIDDTSGRYVLDICNNVVWLENDNGFNIVAGTLNSAAPSNNPTIRPSPRPSFTPTGPSANPTATPSAVPSMPTGTPTSNPTTSLPTPRPTRSPSPFPTTTRPSSSPTTSNLNNLKQTQ